MGIGCLGFRLVLTGLMATSVALPILQGGSSPGVCMSNAPNAGIFVPFEKTHPLLDVDHLKDVVSSKLKDSKELGDLISRQIRDYVDELGLSSDQKASVTDWLQERDGVVRHNILQQLMDQN